MLFLPFQQELDCINSDGQILGKIKFDRYQNAYSFYPDNQNTVLSSLEQASITEKIAKLESGTTLIPMQDDD